MKSIILVGPQGCGKTLNADRIAKAYGLKYHGEYEYLGDVPDDHLLCSNERPHDSDLQVVEFKDAIKKVTSHPNTPKS